MWLIDTNSLQLKEFHDCPAKTYAILSHTWGSAAEEPTFEELQNGKAQEKVGFEKIRLCCEQARSEGLLYAWVDTCCIDKRNSTELSEAINSMFRWYQESKICYVYLADVSDIGPLDSFTSAIYSSIFQGSRWFTRGWTLQELIAPDSLTFFTKEWIDIGNKSDLAEHLHSVTGIDIDVLRLRKSFLDCSIAQRMSWAAHRQTTRLEDNAYSLIGLFNVNLPMMYGEGSKAFLRLQQQIVAQTDDETIFAWTSVPDLDSGLLAPHPISFAESRNIQRGGANQKRSPYVHTNKGLSIECQLLPCDMNTYKVPLQCYWTQPDFRVAQIAIFISRTTDDDRYRRVTYRGKSLDFITRWEVSKAQERKIFVPSNGRGLELAPVVGLPTIHVESDFKIWHVARIEDHVFSTSDYEDGSPSQICDTDSGMPMIDPSAGVVELSSCRLYETKQIQFQKRDLETGIVLAIKRNNQPESDFSHYLQLGFDLDFKPIAFLCKHRFSDRVLRPYCAELISQMLRFCRPYRRGCRFGLAGSFWTVPMYSDGVLYLQKDATEWEWLNDAQSKPAGGLEERPFPEIHFWSSWKLGHRFEGLTLDPIPAELGLSCCKCLQVSIRPLAGLNWTVQIEKRRSHDSAWISNDLVCTECLGTSVSVIIANAFLPVFMLGWLFAVAFILSLVILRTLESSVKDGPSFGLACMIVAISFLARPFIWIWKSVQIQPLGKLRDPNEMIHPRLAVKRRNRLFL